ncbi:MAG: E2/UBC family protein [Candidatus Sedimenticola sp. (ex Thyasira tokunagai)]
MHDVHRWLLSQGFVHVTEETRCYAYDGSIQCNHVEVPIRLSFLDLVFQELPDIHLREPRPEKLCHPLPHVDHQGKLCYLDMESYRLDPYQPTKTIVTLLEQARRVLIGSLSGANSDDVGYEFRLYWDASDCGVVLSNHQSGHSIKYNRLEYQSPTGTTHKQLVVGTDEEIEAYRKWRNGKLMVLENRSALWININTTALLPEKGPWPPQNFRAFHEWLKSVSPAADQSLQKGLGTKVGAQSPLLVVLNTRGGFVSIEAVLPESLSTLTRHPSRFRKQLLMDKGRFGTKFIRGFLDDFSPKFLTTRNLPGSGLSGKRIVVVGLGTIGGYLSRLLVQSGAGQGSGQLILYDEQILSTGNIGRHYLDGSYLYENKAEACRHKLSEEYPTAQILARKKHFEHINDMRQVDFIIDATGREPFSLSLNSQAIQRHHANLPCPPILYIWIDGNGYCGRTLYYDGSGGCYRCLQDLSGKDRFEPLKSMKDLVPMSNQCSESYIPYPPSASVQTAGMGLEAVLDWVNGSPGAFFRSRRFHKKARKHKDHRLTPQEGCPACQS